MKKISMTFAAIAAAFAIANGMMAADDLEKGFLAPPPSARPHTWWHWMNGNVTKEGITADLEAMAQIGLGGAQIFDAGCDVPPGPVRFNSPIWFDTMRFAVSEAKRLGLEIVHPNCSGWSSSGGPWIAPSNAMKSVVFTEAAVKGPAKFSAKLRQPHSPRGYYRDFRVVAFRIPPAEVADREIVPCKIVTPQTDSETELAKLTDRNLDTYVELERKEHDRHVFTVEYVRPVKASCVAYQLDGGENWGEKAEIEVQISSDGKNWRDMGRRPICISDAGAHTREHGWRFFPFESQIEASFLRVRLHLAKRDGYSKFRMGELGFARRMAVSALRGKTFDIRIPVASDAAPTTSDQVVPVDGTIDLTGRMAADGTFSWDVPEGEWCIMRIGYSAKGASAVCASDGGRGLECDKLSAAVLDHHFESYFGRLCRELGEDLIGRDRPGLTGTLVDSYEVGTQNWTEGFEDMFSKMAGYSIEPYLPVFAGRIVGSVEQTERFLWDYRTVISRLFEENYSGALARKCRQYGLAFSLEPYGSCTSDDFLYGAHADVPMGEFWATGGNGAGGRSQTAMLAASIAHIYGRKYIGMESFTSGPPWQGRWRKDPFGLKAIGDRIYGCGANRLIVHRFTHQPWAKDKYLPGMTMGRWGMHFDRSNTWWEHGGKEWISYLTRTQYMLQEGIFCADILFCGAEETPAGFEDVESSFGGSVKAVENRYGFDLCSPAALSLLKVEGGRILSPGGVRYRMLALPPHDTMTPAMLREIGRLVEAGGTIVCERPPVRSPSLAGYPSIDGKVAASAAAIWEKGVMRMTPEKALKTLGVEPDFDCADEYSLKRLLVHQHRRQGGTDWYFIACANPDSPKTIECSFRVSDRIPEIWDAESRTVSDAKTWRVSGGRTFVSLPFSNSGALFVVFRRPRGEVSGATAPKPQSHLKVVKAEYGSFPEQVADVTLAVAAMVAGDRLNVFADNRLTGGVDPARNKLKELRVTYLDGGKEHTAVAKEYKRIDVVAASGAVNGPWRVAFPHGFAPNAHAKGADELLMFDKLISWTERPERGARYFSGTATYSKTVEGVKRPVDGGRLILDLGVVKNIAEVTVNGKTYPALWKPPFRVDITDAVDGSETVRMEIKVTNLWPNRLIGDDSMPLDCEWIERPHFRKIEWGIKEIPDWVKEGKQSPTGRHTFTTWKHWSKDDELLPSGLLGPVTIR